MATADQANKNIKNYFENAYGKELTDAEVAEYKDRVVNLFSLLADIDQRNKKLKKN